MKDKFEPKYVLHPYSKLVKELGEEGARVEMAKRSMQRKNFKGGRPKIETNKTTDNEKVSKS